LSLNVLITGATGGLGRELASAFHAKGYRLTLVDMDAIRLQEMCATYSGSRPHVLDQLDQGAVAGFCDTVIAECDFDVAILNAGMLSIGEFATLERKSILSQLQVNLVSSALMIQSLAQRMTKRRSGHIIATVSMGGIVSLKGSATYSASKFGLRGLLWGLRDELSSQGVQVTGIYPAGIDTPMLRHEALHGGSALNFVSTPTTVQEVANAILGAVARPQLEVYVPRSESLTSRLLAFWPDLLARLYPVLEYLGEKGRMRYLRRVGERA
jgi:short-subunit dehydrogenase